MQAIECVLPSHESMMAKTHSYLQARHLPPNYPNLHNGMSAFSPFQPSLYHGSSHMNGIAPPVVPYPPEKCHTYMYLPHGHPHGHAHGPPPPDRCKEQSFNEILARKTHTPPHSRFQIPERPTHDGQEKYTSHPAVAALVSLSASRAQTTPPALHSIERSEMNDDCPSRGQDADLPPERDSRPRL